MTQSPRIPNPQVNQRLLANLRQTRLEMKVLGLQLEEAIAVLDEQMRQQQLQRVQQSLASAGKSEN